MTLRHRHPDTHALYRALISQRLDERLTTEDARALRSHLLTCARCRAADRDFRAQRILLQGSSPAVPPRDLWARTSAALDREVARGGHSGMSREPLDLRRRTPRAAIASLVGMMLVVAVLGNQLGRNEDIVARPSGVSVAPTPFEVPTQELAFVGHDEAGLAIYRTDVSLVCPERAIDCATVSSGKRQVIRVGGTDHLKPSSVAFHPQGNKVAIAASAGRGEALYVVFLKPVRPSIDAEETDAPRTPASATFTSSSGATATATFAVAPTGGAAAATTPASSPDATPRPTGEATTGSKPPSTPKATRSPGPGSADPSTAPPTDEPTPRPTDAPTRVPETPAITNSTPAGDLSADIQPILQDVLPAGAEPAWSPDGETLAFSAMPADGSHGPDIYIWRTGAQKAKRLTADHRSYFASWAGSRIVASRAAHPTDRSGGLRDPGLRVTNVVIDLVTGEQRRISARGLWLPVVDPTERFAVVWRGELRQVGPALRPVSGALFLADWRRLDPFRVSAGGALFRVGEGGTRPRNLDALPQGTPSGGSAPSTPVSNAASASPASKATEPARSTGPRRTRTPETTASPSPRSTPSATQAPTTRPSPTEDPAAGAQPIEPGRDARLDPVLDWQVRWNTDGDAYGFWIAETPGASWGRLAIVAVDRSTGRINREAALLGPTLARKTFTVGQDRVAWVAPVDDQPDGELRVRTWGPNGSGTVRIRDLDGEGVPGF